MPRRYQATVLLGPGACLAQRFDLLPQALEFCLRQTTAFAVTQMTVLDILHFRVMAFRNADRYFICEELLRIRDSTPVVEYWPECTIYAEPAQDDDPAGSHFTDNDPMSM